MISNNLTIRFWGWSVIMRPLKTVWLMAALLGVVLDVTWYLQFRSSTSSLDQQEENRDLYEQTYIHVRDRELPGLIAQAEARWKGTPTECPYLLNTSPPKGSFEYWSKRLCELAPPRAPNRAEIENQSADLLVEATLSAANLSEVPEPYDAIQAIREVATEKLRHRLFMTTFALMSWVVVGITGFFLVRSYARDFQTGLRATRVVAALVGALFIAASISYYWTVWSQQAPKLELYRLVIAGRVSVKSVDDLIGAKVEVQRALGLSGLGALIGGGLLTVAAIGQVRSRKAIREKTTAE